MISRILFIALFLPIFSISQTLTGRVVDKSTQEPIETASIYFDNTTVGTTTDENGEFSISYTNAIQSILVISYLGYERVLIADYRDRSNLVIELVEADNELDEVFIAYDDGLTRRQKLRLFRKEFLGSSKFGKSCKILNEEDIILHYDKQDRILYASSPRPIKILNKALQYEIDYDIEDFEIKFRYVDTNTNEFVYDRILITGTSFYENLKDSEKKSVLKKRKNAFEGSVQHFMRSLYNENLYDEGYLIFHKGFKVKEWDYFKVRVLENSDLKEVKLIKKVTILFNKDLQSDLYLTLDKFYVDAYGNYTPIIGVYFSGYMGSQRVGDALPLDYGLD
ncbi:carboxypeptidase-like regulatory domain-containing protein [Winogradskyella flava]|uniref:Carboxypeptidase-like regulatory domain-containing protein n=1 Tax=Winogradskyella flava TaxID=1884876 RepID=A0A842IMX7_9FLAO|nr:carboxypeptidase-like regulatory domain-containing protein [Winogradskyella flava]MBC2844101.1 carboxypeptidase-like regulatory domain-containing protein [Winogradskyella flava]